MLPCLLARLLAGMLDCLLASFHGCLLAYLPWSLACRLAYLLWAESWWLYYFCTWSNAHKSKTQRFWYFHKVSEVIWRSQELPLNKIDTPIYIYIWTLVYIYTYTVTRIYIYGRVSFLSETAGKADSVTCPMSLAVSTIHTNSWSTTFLLLRILVFTN